MRGESGATASWRYYIIHDTDRERKVELPSLRRGGSVRSVAIGFRQETHLPALPAPAASYSSSTIFIVALSTPALSLQK
jgi:hypothetical protein